MEFRPLFAAACAISMVGQSVQAVPPTTVAEAIAQINSDAVLLSGWVSDQFKRAIPFNSTAGNVVPSQLKVFGVEVGASAVVSGTESDQDAFRALGTQIVDTTQIDTFDRLPVPLILGHAKIGLPMGFDVGMRLGGIPSTDTDEGDTHMEVSNTVFGLDVRKVLIEEGAAKPFGLTAGLNYSRAKGHVTATTPYSSNQGNVTFTDAIGTARSEWTTQSVGAQLLMNKQVLFMNPYIGIAANKTFGDVTTSITNTGTVRETGSNQTASLAGTGGQASATPSEWDLRGMLGLEFTFLPFLKLGIGGEIASQNNLAASLGLRFQFR